MRDDAEFTLKKSKKIYVFLLVTAANMMFINYF